MPITFSRHSSGDQEGLALKVIHVLLDFSSGGHNSANPLIAKLDFFSGLAFFITLETVSGLISFC